uniref:Uncharacterized protein n=1 Tax=Kwoniella dejecticola CBS 10117 TaxID=1296121 RepID=A0A1A6A5M7_9TREE|nr:uncharacterized protein I303_04694 [Kwoniella dejecticola CBS 10117]OBR85359.1 hypothetical protein I303_04694 [Kwoniella dejecticola CBS 10117]
MAESHSDRSLGSLISFARPSPGTCGSIGNHEDNQENSSKRPYPSNRMTRTTAMIKVPTKHPSPRFIILLADPWIGNTATQPCDSHCHHNQDTHAFMPLHHRLDRPICPGSNDLLSKLNRLIITGQAMKEWVDWIDRHQYSGYKDPGQMKDEVLAFITKLAYPKNMCLSMPIYDKQDFLDYRQNRSQNDVQPSNAGREEFSVTHFRKMTGYSAMNIAIAACDTRGRGDVGTTLHDVSSDTVLFSIPPSTIFFGPFLSSHTEPGGQEVTKETRIRQLQSLLWIIYHRSHESPHISVTKLVMPAAEIEAAIPNVPNMSPCSAAKQQPSVSVVAREGAGASQEARTRRSSPQNNTNFLIVRLDRASDLTVHTSTVSRHLGITKT